MSTDENTQETNDKENREAFNSFEKTSTFSISMLLNYNFDDDVETTRRSWGISRGDKLENFPLSYCVTSSIGVESSLRRWNNNIFHRFFGFFFVLIVQRKKLRRTKKVYSTEKSNQTCRQLDR